jgi:hypothetical protein
VWISVIVRRSRWIGPSTAILLKDPVLFKGRTLGGGFMFATMGRLYTDTWHVQMGVHPLLMYLDEIEGFKEY